LETEEWELLNDNLISNIPKWDDAIICDLQFIPIFKNNIRTYTLTFYDSEGKISEVITEQPYGTLLSSVAVTKPPYKNDLDLPHNQTYGFIGYGLNATTLTPVPDTYTIQADQEFYPIFEQKSVYDNIMDSNAFDITRYVNGYSDDYDSHYDYAGVMAAIKPKRNLVGKITIPAYVPDPDDKSKLLPV
jgi:hypothetical protein